MEKLKGNLLYGQSGGPTSVINASAYGVIERAKKSDQINDIYIMKHGIQGALNEDFYDAKKQSKSNIELLKHTPGSAFGSIRYKLSDYEDDDSDYKRLLEVFKKYNIRYFLYNGGNDSMDTCAKIANYMESLDYDIRVIGIPKTIDNDLPYTDHTPGYGSAAKYIANTVAEIAYDTMAYPIGKVTIVEIMGRHAGWLTAASALANVNGFGPDLIYLPEKPFSLTKFKEEVKTIYSKNKKCLIAVSEGIVNELGEFIFSSSNTMDDFGHSQLGGVAAKLAELITRELKIATRSVELSSSQRAASHFQSLTDVNEAIKVGEKAVELALNNQNNLMVIIKRESNNPYSVNYEGYSLSAIANQEKKMPDRMINKDCNGVTDEFIKYAQPLINGQNKPKFKKGIQLFAKMK
ncbi:MAG: 6-phosphofructokinase [Candidatus Izimaplasma sp.]|nr:6-phosphofructokinase [Candidatus Izimaplasma bacterium]